MEEICERYKQLYAGAVYDVLESLGYPNQALSHELTALAPGMKLAGPAFTVKGTVTAERDEAGRHQRMKMVCSMMYHVSRCVIGAHRSMSPSMES